MSDIAVIYESSTPGQIEEVVDALRDEGFHPALKEDAGAAYYRMKDKRPGVTGLPQGRMKISIVVPQDEEAAARLFLHQREERAGSDVAELTGGLRRPLILSILATIIASIIMASLYPEEGAFMSVVFALMSVFPASFILTVNSRNTASQICALIITVAAIVCSVQRLGEGQVGMACFLLFLPAAGVAYIFLRTHKLVLSRKKMLWDEADDELQGSSPGTDDFSDDSH